MGRNAQVGTGDLSARGSVPASAVSSLTARRLFRHEWRYPPLKFMNSITPERVDFTSRRRANLRRYTWNLIISGAAETWEFLPGTSLPRLYFPRRRWRGNVIKGEMRVLARCSTPLFRFHLEQGRGLFLQPAKRNEKRKRHPVCFFWPSLKRSHSATMFISSLSTLFGGKLKTLMLNIDSSTLSSKPSSSKLHFYKSFFIWSGIVWLISILYCHCLTELCSAM